MAAGLVRPVAEFMVATQIYCFCPNCRRLVDSRSAERP